MSDTKSYEVNNSPKQDSNYQENPDNVANRKNLNLRKPESYGTIRMVSTQTYTSGMEELNE